MNSSLYNDRNEFKKRALSTPIVSVKKRREESPHTAPRSTKPIQSSYKSNNSAITSVRFGYISKIVRHMKSRFHQDISHGLTLSEILDETNLLTVGQATKKWLQDSALVDNPKISVEQGPKGPLFSFKPALPVNNYKSLLKYLNKQSMLTQEGTLMEDIVESVVNSEKVMAKLADKVIIIKRQSDKKEVVFFKDASKDFSVNEKFVELFRSTSVAGLDDRDIEIYLREKGITSMANAATKFVPPKRRAPKRKQQPVHLKTNAHMIGVLKEYNNLS